MLDNLYDVGACAIHGISSGGGVSAFLVSAATEVQCRMAPVLQGIVLIQCDLTCQQEFHGAERTTLASSILQLFILINEIHVIG